MVRRVVLLLTVIAAGAFAAPAQAIVPLPPHPWIKPSEQHTPFKPHPSAALCSEEGVKCPDLAMRAPYQFRPDVYEGRHVLRAANAVLSIGPGPVELHGRRAGGRSMNATQYVLRAHRSKRKVPGGAGKIVYQLIPGQGRIWKYQDAARFELWTTDSTPRRVRIGEKLIYCLRDLRRLFDWSRTPRAMFYPACSKDPNKKRVVLGTSPGWTDIYPATYYDQFIDVEGLVGCYELVHVADPSNHIIETDETNNSAATKVRLPMGKRNVSRC